MHALLQGHVEQQRMPGLAALVARDDDVDVFVTGTQSFGAPASMRRDSIFRVASVTKLVTAVATMMLVEAGRLRLDDSIEPWPADSCPRSTTGSRSAA